MKIFQILNSICWWDATSTVHTIEEAHEMFPPTDLFVEAPDYVFEGWGYDEHAKGDDRFIQPERPEGWRYDAKSGTFSLEEKEPAEQLADMIAELKETLARAEKLLDEITPKEEVRK